MIKIKFSVKNLLVVSALMCGLMFTNCGGGSGSGKKLASNEFLGDLPNLVYQNGFKDSVRNAKEDAEMNKLNPSKISDWEKGAKIKEKFKAQKEEAKKEFNAELEKLKPAIVGKDIPFEMEEGLGYEIISFNVTEIDSYGSVRTNLEVKITDPKEANLMRYANALSVKLHEVDTDGNKIGYEREFNINLSGKTEGATGNYTYYVISFYPKDAVKYVNFDKIKFVK